MKISIQYDRDLLQLIAIRLDRLLSTPVPDRDFGRMLHSILKSIHIRHNRLLVDPDKKTFIIRYSVHSAIAIKMMLQVYVDEFGETLSWEGNEYLKIIAKIDQLTL